MHRLLLTIAAPYVALSALTSLFVNLLYLTSPLYLTQIYERVLGSQSENTLIALSGLMVFAFGLLALFERLRSWVFSRLATRLDLKATPKIFNCYLANQAAASGKSKKSPGLRQAATDLDQIRRFTSSPGPAAFLDLPFLALYLLVLFAIHSWLGIYALASVTLVLSLAAIGFWRQSSKSQDQSKAKLLSYQALDKVETAKEIVTAQGLERRMTDLLSHGRFVMTNAEAQAGAQTQSWSSTNKGIRMVLQSGVLGLAAYLVLQQAMPPALIFACMILLGRIMAPIDVISNTWSSLLSSRTAWKRLSSLTLDEESRDGGIEISNPQGALQLQNLTLTVTQVADRTFTLIDDISLEISPGSLVAIVGASGAGKTSLLRSIAGVVPASSGQVLFDGIDIQTVKPNQRSTLLSYNPQSSVFLPGTIAENISGFKENAYAEELVEAAEFAQIHQRISQLPMGYETPIDLAERIFSGGEKARLSLARSLFGPPRVILLDEPTAALEPALRKKIASRLEDLTDQGHTIIVATHDHAFSHQASHILVLDKGKLKTFGPRDQVLRQPTPHQIVAAAKSGAGNASRHALKVVPNDTDNQLHSTSGSRKPSHKID